MRIMYQLQFCVTGDFFRANKMSFLHVYLKTTHLKHTYEINAKPEMEEGVCDVIHRSFQPASYELVDMYPGCRKVTINCHPYINRRDKSGLPGDLALRSEIFLTLLHGLEEDGWEVVVGSSIHDHEGMIFRKRSRQHAMFNGRRRAADADVEMLDGCSYAKTTRK